VASVHGFTAEETSRDARERAREVKAARWQRGRGARRAREDRRDAEADRAMAERLHALIKASAPALSPRTWYGMPAYAKDGKVVCFFQSAQKFKSRYRRSASATRRTWTKAPCGRRRCAEEADERPTRSESARLVKQAVS
jgi:uncharacterized protein YdhG (YjbR/CyaY superfamily)